MTEPCTQAKPTKLSITGVRSFHVKSTQPAKAITEPFITSHLSPSLKGQSIDQYNSVQ